MRKFFYPGFFILCILLVVWKGHVIKKKEKKTVSNIQSEWKENGKPVDVFDIKRSDMFFYSKVSGVITASNRMQAYVPVSIYSKLKRGLPFFFNPELDNNPTGYVSYIAENPDMLTGLYLIQLTLNQPMDKAERTILKVEIQTAVQQNVIKIPLAAIIQDGNENWVWVMKDKQVEKRQVQVGMQNLHYVKVLSGLEAGEKIVVRGKELLQEKDAVRVHQVMMSSKQKMVHKETDIPFSQTEKKHD